MKNEKGFFYFLTLCGEGARRYYYFCCVAYATSLNRNIYVLRNAHFEVKYDQLPLFCTIHFIELDLAPQQRRWMLAIVELLQLLGIVINFPFMLHLINSQCFQALHQQQISMYHNDITAITRKIPFFSFFAVFERKP